MKRTHKCNELNMSNVGKKVTLAGFVKRIRSFGELVFIDLRDHYGITQLVVNQKELAKKVKNLPSESTIAAKGIVMERKDKNPNLPTGDIELLVEEIEIFAKAKANLPFEVNKDYKNNKEDLRLEYRYIDLRNEEIHNNIVLRSKIMKDTRNYMDKKEFVEIQTPIFASSSPEGARDYLVPSRLHKGEFYALPQAPQQFKQLLMVSGFDKYYQIAPCFRDEDPRADRSPCEFYQIDFEMAFAEEDDVHEVLKGVALEIFTKNTDYNVDENIPKIPYKIAMEKYGIDKPDLRNPLILKDVTEIFKDEDITIFKDKHIIMCVMPKLMPRKFYDNLTELLKQEKDAKGLAWMKIENGVRSGGVSKLISDKIYEKLVEKEKENTIENIDFENYSMFLVADEETSKAQDISGMLRIKIGEESEIIPENEFKFCFIVDFPFFEKDKEGNVDFSHNPFSKPKCTIKDLDTKNPYEIVANQYDLVCNGYEIASGAARNYDIDMMIKVFEKVGYTKEDVERRFSALYKAFSYGVPPHAGAALGLDRIVMLLAKTNNIREVIAFPKNKKARDLMIGAPSVIDKSQLEELGIEVIKEK